MLLDINAQPVSQTVMDSQQIPPAQPQPGQYNVPAS